MGQIHLGDRDLASSSDSHTVRICDPTNGRALQVGLSVGFLAVRLNQVRP